MTICIAGKNNIAVDCLYYVLSFISPSDLCVVLNQTDQMRNTWQKSLGYYANKEGIGIKSLKEVQEIQNLIFLSLEFDRIIKPNLFKSSKLFNIHFSLLPEYKGMFTSFLPILHGKKKSGVTFHLIDSGIDTGDILAQEIIDIDSLTCCEVYNKYLNCGTRLVCEEITKIIEGEATTNPQPAFNSTYFGKDSVDFKKREINPFQTAYQIQQFIRAFNFRVYQLAEFSGNQIFSSEILAHRSILRPGDIINDDVEKTIISTIDYDIVLFKDYYNVLLEYCRSNNFDAAKEIIYFVQEIDQLNMKGWNPLIVAAYNGAEDLVELLLSRGANPNAQNMNGTTVLMYAKDSYLKTGKLGIINLLIKAGAKTATKDIHGKDIFDYTNDRRLIELLKLNAYD